MPEIPLILPSERRLYLNQLDQVAAHVEQRAALFGSRLADLSKAASFTNYVDFIDCDDLGWEKITRSQDGRIAKQPAQRLKSDTLFTGRGFCLFASQALKEGIKDISSSDIHLTIHELFPNLFEEHRGTDLYNKTIISEKKNHYILHASQNGYSLIFDPTYGQINHRFAGKTLIIEVNQLNDFYKLHKGYYQEYDPHVLQREMYPIGMKPEHLEFLASAITL